MKIILANEERKVYVIELDIPFQFSPRYERKAKFVCIDLNRDIEYYKNSLIYPKLFASTYLKFGHNFEKTEIKQKDFPEKILTILKVMGILDENEDTINQTLTA